IAARERNDMSSMQKLMKQAQQMQEGLHRRVAETLVQASVGGGRVAGERRGHKQLVSVKIDPEVMDKDDPSMLEDLIVAAVNEAGRKVEETMQGRMGALAAGMPGLFSARPRCPSTPRAN